jgi:hypothetical protein
MLKLFQDIKRKDYLINVRLLYRGVQYDTKMTEKSPQRLFSDKSSQLKLLLKKIIINK